ncbi:MAG: HAD-IC family P-type ATPase, partial [archaeon]|nr:HAD-IC family P-type ATPase [archaeon]
MWHTKDKKEVLDELNTNEYGLNDGEAGLRLKKYGKNEIKQIVKITPLMIFLNQFKSVFVMILLFAAVFSLIAGHYLDFGVIGIIIILNSFIGFYQQYSAEITIAELKKMLVPKVRVIRSGRLEEISSLDLVPGDIIMLSEGDKVTADCRLLHTNDLQTNEAVLTGESFPQDKSSSVLKADVILANRENMVYTGTNIVRGNGKAVVVTTNMHTEFGKIAKLVQQIKTEITPFEKKLDSFSKKVAITVILLALFTIFIGIYHGEEIFNMILAGVSLAVSVVPEGLPAILAITLAFAIKRMKKHNSLIRKLPAAETLGRTTVICTDKTGTLTEEKMSVSNVYAKGKFFNIKNNKFYSDGKKLNPKNIDELELLLKIGIMCNNARLEIQGDKIEIFGDPTEKALVMSAYHAGILKNKVVKKEERIMEYSFSSSRKMMSIVRKKNGGMISYVKGAPEVILKRCTKEFIHGNVVSLTEKRRLELKAVHEGMASEAL